MAHERQEFWYYLGFGLMLFLILFGIGSCCALADLHACVKQ